jgi:tRNA pseudouridine55 synthase
VTQVTPAPPAKTATANGGVLSINKAPGQTSFAVVRDVRRILGERRVGHAGTLDPRAQGLLPICVGRATRLVDYFHLQPKTYHCRIRLGERSDTHDTEGEVTTGADASHLDAAGVDAVLRGFVGEIDQVPPMHSAVRHDGEHLYDLARRGESVERQPRRVTIHAIRLLDFRPGAVAEADVEVECGKGTYMRVLAADCGETLGVGGLLGWLERTRYGPLDLNTAITIERLGDAGDPWSLLLPPDVAISFLPRIDLGPQLAAQIRQGQAVFVPGLPDPRPQGEARVHAATGELIALGELQGARFRPTKVFAG